MIKYFDFENEVEKIDIQLSQLDINNKLDFDKIEKLNVKKSELFKKILMN